MGLLISSPRFFLGQAYPIPGLQTVLMVSNSLTQTSFLSSRCVSPVGLLAFLLGWIKYLKPHIPKTECFISCPKSTPSPGFPTSASGMTIQQFPYASDLQTVFDSCFSTTTPIWCISKSSLIQIYFTMMALVLPGTVILPDPPKHQMPGDF